MKLVFDRRALVGGRATVGKPQELGLVVERHQSGDGFVLARRRMLFTRDAFVLPLASTHILSPASLDSSTWR